MNSNNTSSTSLAALPAVLQLNVMLEGRRVGALASTNDGRVAFEYDALWIAEGFSISPYSLPLQTGVFVPERQPFNGLYGVFNDSMPDGWGALLLDRMIATHGQDPHQTPTLTKLPIIGSGGRGGLVYEPDLMPDNTASTQNLDILAQECAEIFEGTSTKSAKTAKSAKRLDEVFLAGGSSAGARPKAYVMIDGSEWLVKFPSSIDPPHIGEQEFAYSQAAKECDVSVAEAQLFPSQRCGGYFGTKRFDRNTQGTGIHMVTASGLLEVSHRIPQLDYRHLMQVTRDLTRDDNQLWELYKRMCFNVFAHNQDDHSNNFSWLCESGTWRLSPAYDLTHSTSFGGEQSTTVNGKGKPTMKDLLILADEAGLPYQEAFKAAQFIEKRCQKLLQDLGL